MRRPPVESDTEKRSLEGQQRSANAVVSRCHGSFQQAAFHRSSLVISQTADAATGPLDAVRFDFVGGNAGMPEKFPDGAEDAVILEAMSSKAIARKMPKGTGPSGTRSFRKPPRSLEVANRCLGKSGDHKKPIPRGRLIKIPPFPHQRR